MHKISAIVPVAPWDFDRSMLMFRSLKKFFDPGGLEIIYITFHDRQKMQDAIKAMDLDFRVDVLTEEDIIPTTDYTLFKKRDGWIRQQIIKLAISGRMKTDHYICLDSDLMCIKPSSSADLFKNNKPGINMEPKSWHARWWKASRKVLKLPDPGTSTGMCSSTNIFMTGEAMSLISHVENIYKKSFSKTLLNWFWTDTYFLRRKWTEYTLYWLFIEHRNKTDAYDPGNKLLGKSIWKKTKKIHEGLFREIFNPVQEGYFTICQSSRIPDHTVLRYAKQFLDI